MTSGFLDNETPEPQVKPPTQWRSLSKDGNRPVSMAESEIEIGGRRYINKRRLASILGVSVRTLSRWDDVGIGPPKIKVGRKVLFDLLKLPDWLTSRET